jgi:hypothetical protein
VRAWAIFLVSTVAFSLLTPHGPRGLWVTWQTLVQDTYVLSHIGEWLSPNFHVFQPLELWVVGGLAVVLYQGLRLPPVRLMLLLGLLHPSLKHMRYVELLGQLAPVFLASPLAAQWRQRRQGRAQMNTADRFFEKLSRPAGTGAIAVGIACFLGIPWLIAQTRPFAPPESIAPLAAIRAAEDAGLTGPVLNAYHWGGYLKFLGIPAFIDGRSDLYRDAFIEDYLMSLDLRKTDGIEKLIETRKVSWTLLPPETPAVARLDRMPGWNHVYADKTAVVHAKDVR